MSSPFVGPFFEILAGPNRTSFLVHAGILEKSQKFRAIVRGEWKDSLERQVVLDDWDVETVGRLVEWLYTGDYESPYPARVPQSDAEIAEVRFPETSVPSSPGVESSQGTPKNETAEGSQRPLTPFEHVYFEKADTELSYTETFKQRMEQENRWCQHWAGIPPDYVFNFEATLLAHGKLYALADYVLLPALQAQVFQRLKTVLVFMGRPGLSNPLIAEITVIEDLMRLVQYVYTNTARVESEEEPLRKLISTFITEHYDQLGNDGGEVSRIMEQSGDFLRDVHDKVRRNEAALKGELKCVKKQLDILTGW